MKLWQNRRNRHAISSSYTVLAIRRTTKHAAPRIAEVTATAVEALKKSRSSSTAHVHIVVLRCRGSSTLVHNVVLDCRRIRSTQIGCRHGDGKYQHEKERLEEKSVHDDDRCLGLVCGDHQHEISPKRSGKLSEREYPRLRRGWHLAKCGSYSTVANSRLIAVSTYIALECSGLGCP